MRRKSLIYILLLLSSVTGSSAQDIDYPFAGDIRRFIESDRLNPPPPQAALFIGSSSFTMWKDMHDYFPEFTVVNRGFGGSTLTDQIRYADEIIFPYSPSQIVIYCGENDIASSDSITPEMVSARFMTLFEMIRDRLTGVRIIFVSMKPSPSRWHLAGKMAEANELIRKLLETKSNAGFVNIWDSMLNQDHLPDSSLFITDMLHMNSKGYAIWQKLIEPELISSSDREMDAFIGDLMKRMTLDEKIGQLNLISGGWTTTGPEMPKDNQELIRQGNAGAVLNAYSVDYLKSLQRIAVEETRLGIPIFFGLDVVHGFRTIFPIPLAQACSWDLEAIEKSERIAASEATAMGLSWAFAPMVDIARDPRWGRVMEGAGEDACLGGMIARARVKGFQGNDLKTGNTMMACVKHFAAYGAPQAGRDYNTVDMSDRSLFEWYLPPYKAALDAGAGSLMTSFNEIAGVPSSSNRWLLTDLLRGKWGFDGFVVSDWTSVPELIRHGVASDTVDAARLALNAGLDMDMEGMTFIRYLKTLTEDGTVTEETIDSSVKRVLEAKYKLGLFENPYRYCDKNREENDILTPGNIAFARQFAAGSMVLLKNEENTLPVNKKVKTIAVIGPLADSRENMLGGWSAAGQTDRCVTVLEALREKAGDSIRIIYQEGCSISSRSASGINSAVKAARKADFVILALGESQDMSGEASSRTNISLPGIQMDLARAVLGTGIPGVVVLFNGRPLTIEGLDSIAPAILEAWYGGIEAGHAVADILFGDVNPSGKLTMTFPRSVGQIPIFYNHKNTGRPIDPAMPDDYFKSRYKDSPNTPLYPFGFGLSYSRFEYSKVTMKKTSLTMGDRIEASVDITNSGSHDGEEIVQLYVRDRVGDVTRPVRELKDFRKVRIRKGETVTVTFNLPLSILSYYHQDMCYTYDPGEFELFIGTSSDVSDFVLFTVR
jgi:beta-glucosidase